MDKAYIILAHKNMEQLNRLLARLDDGCSYFFIHIDAKLPDRELSALVFNQEKAQLVDRIFTKWADFSIVEATLKALEAVRASNKEFGSISILSGQDYPIKSNEYISDFLAHSDKRIFMEHFELPNHEKWSPRGGMYRIDKYFFGLKEYELFTSRTFNFLGSIFPGLKRSHPEHLKHYAGSQWWTIDMYALNYILNFVKANPAYTAFHKATFAPDEIFFHTILLNAKDTRIRSGIAGNNKRFIRWKTTSMSHPEFLTRDDLEDMRHSDALFARKFDLEETPEIFNLIDQQCVNEKTVAA
jgi:hypothetical protein